MNQMCRRRERILSCSCTFVPARTCEVLSFERQTRLRNLFKCIYTYKYISAVSVVTVAARVFLETKKKEKNRLVERRLRLQCLNCLTRKFAKKKPLVGFLRRASRQVDTLGIRSMSLRVNHGGNHAINSRKDQLCVPALATRAKSEVFVSVSVEIVPHSAMLKAVDWIFAMVETSHFRPSIRLSKVTHCYAGMKAVLSVLGVGYKPSGSPGLVDLHSLVYWNYRDASECTFGDPAMVILPPVVADAFVCLTRDLSHIPFSVFWFLLFGRNHEGALFRCTYMYCQMCIRLFTRTRAGVDVSGHLKF